MAGSAMKMRHSISNGAWLPGDLREDAVLAHMGSTRNGGSKEEALF